MTSPDVCVIICTHTEKRWDYLVKAVASVKAQTIAAHQIIVVVDHNPTLLARVRQLGVTAVENSEQRGASGSKNSGVAAAKTEIVAFLDDDAVAETDWLQQLLACYDDPSVIGSGGAIEPLWNGAQPKWFPEELYWVFGCTYRGLPQQPAPVRNLIACNMSFKREVFEHVGGFRAGIGPQGGRPLGCEETEFGIRVNHHYPGKIILYQPKAKAYHQVPQSRATWRYLCLRCYGEGTSKALVSKLVGAHDSLSSEWDYTLHTLPQGVLRGLRDALLGRDLQGLGRASAIMLGLAVTAAGYLVGTYQAAVNRKPLALTS